MYMETFIFRLIALILMAGLSPFYLFSQFQPMDGAIDVNRGMPNSMIKEIPYIPDSYEGTHYLHEHWNQGKIELKNGSTIEGLPLKYDLQMERMEIRVEKEKVKILDRNEMLRFVWVDSASGDTAVYINGGDFYYIASTATNGMFELVEEGEEMSLLSKKEIVVKEGVYNVQIDMGDRTPKYVKVETFYLLKGKLAFKLPNTRRNRYLIFEGHSPSVMAFAKANKLKFKKREHLKKIVAYFNELEGN